MKNLIKLISVIFMALFCSQVANADPANDSTIILTFEGLKDQEAIRNFYNGGSGSKGSTSYADYGIQFSSNALALIDTDAGGSGNFGNEPSPDTVMYFLTGESAVLNKDDGFDTGFSFYYSAINNPGKVVVYDGLNAQGTALATINLPVTDSDGGDPNGDFSPFYQVGVPFSGTARSIDFGGTIDQIGFDDITFGSATPGVTAKVPFLVGDPATNTRFSSKLSLLQTNECISSPGSAGNCTIFNPDLPTYIVTHGWQSGTNGYENEEFSFPNQLMPSGQKEILEAIRTRLKVADSFGINRVEANILAFEWEGAYPEGGLLNKSAANKARINADYAGVLLGRALEDMLGESYTQDLHFIGHSYGTVVNAVATRYLETTKINPGSVQFTTLDSPTDKDTYAQDLDEDWFANNLSRLVDYFDNYYGILPFSYGEVLDGAGLNLGVPYHHGNIDDSFYPKYVISGYHYNDGQHDPSTTAAITFLDWITPALSSFSSRPGSDFVAQNDSMWSEAIDLQSYTDAINTVSLVSTSLVDGQKYYTFSGLKFVEQSPVSIYYSLDVPLGAEWLYFDWMVDNGGDGDWITVHFGSDLLWSMGISDFLEGILLNALLDISTYAGQSGNLWFTLNSVDEANASFYIGNLEFRGSNIFADSTVPEPATLTLLCVGLLGLYWARLRRKHRFN